MLNFGGGVWFWFPRRVCFSCLGIPSPFITIPLHEGANPPTFINPLGQLSCMKKSPRFWKRMGAVLVTEQTHGASDWWKFLMRDFFVPWFSSDFPFVNLVTQMETPLFLSPLTVSMSLGVALHWPHMVYGICIHTYRPGKDMSNSANTWIFTISLGASIKRRNFRNCQVHSWRSSAVAGCSGAKAGCGWDGFGLKQQIW